jgi:putative glutathione S-transferase
LPHPNQSVYLIAKKLTIDEENVRGVFKAMDQMDEILSKNKYLVGDQLTEADIRAYTTSARFDVAYHGAFKCNIRLFRSYPNLNRWLKSIYWSEEYPEFKHTTLFDTVRQLIPELIVV